MSTLGKISPEILTDIVKALRESYSPFELDKSVYSLALTCRIFYRICEPLLYSRYRNEDKCIGKLSEFIRMLILRPDRWPGFKFVSIEWNRRTSHGSLSRAQHVEMLADVPFLKTAIDQLPDEIYRLQSRPNGKIGEVEKRKLCTQYVTDLAETFKRLLDVGDVQPYSELLIYMFTILSPYIQKLQIEIKSSGGHDSGRPWRLQIFPEANHLKFISLKEFHYVTVTARRSKPREAISIPVISAEQLDLFMRIPTLKKLKLRGFAFSVDLPSHWVTKPGSCGVESLDLMYNFSIDFVKWRIFLSVFQKLKHFSYDGNFKGVIRRERPIDGAVTPRFLGKLMEGIFVHGSSLESFSLVNIRRLKSDHTHLEISTTPGFTQFSCLKQMRIQLDLLIGVEGESVKTLELWCQASLECMSLTDQLLGLKTHKEVFPSFALREVKLVYVIEMFQVEETWKIDMIKDLWENGIHLVLVGLPIKDVWWSPGLLNWQSMGRGSISQQTVRSKDKEYN
ncbi:uncharacterized protein Bfra_005822 [Botrytis fragariae]|uniref:Uncharacterized protein n=1 Tax=Botrytis fragariae TaxID=1964551 RepID=A0A8H6EHH5_9HELO|nr:uncharacterized protein Bfra_005822 [Botrytis fragariae]KAF5872462.1 hypothetical protein Bfra_005822 [Botrytis fragariae]